MTLLQSLFIPLGTAMPDFSLTDPSGRKFIGNKLYGTRGLMVGFLCNHCPYAIAVWPRFIRWAAYARAMGINTVAINPNIHPDYPQDAPDKMLEKIKEWHIDFPYLVDETQDAARAFKAQCTPDIFLFDGAKKLIYHGRIDDHWQEEKGVKKEELKEALDHYAAGRTLTKDQKPSMGCSIKWRDS